MQQQPRSVKVAVGAAGGAPPLGHYSISHQGQGGAIPVAASCWSGQNNNDGSSGYTTATADCPRPDDVEMAEAPPVAAAAASDDEQGDVGLLGDLSALVIARR
jgi:hypothetical protein